MMTVFSTGCCNCKRLIEKLDSYNISYSVSQDVEYIKTSDFTVSYPALTYNYRDKAETQEYWEYELDSKCNLVSVYYTYRNSLDESSGLSIQYSIDVNKGTAILAKAKELAGK